MLHPFNDVAGILLTKALRAVLTIAMKPERSISVAVMFFLIPVLPLLSSSALCLFDSSENQGLEVAEMSSMTFGSTRSSLWIYLVASTDPS